VGFTHSTTYFVHIHGAEPTVPSMIGSNHDVLRLQPVGSGGFVDHPRDSERALFQLLLLIPYLAKV